MVWTLFLVPKNWDILSLSEGILQCFMTIVYPKFTCSRKVVQGQVAYKRDEVPMFRLPFLFLTKTPTQGIESKIQRPTCCESLTMHRTASHNAEFTCPNINSSVKIEKLWVRVPFKCCNKKDPKYYDSNKTEMYLSLSGVGKVDM